MWPEAGPVVVDPVPAKPPEPEGQAVVVLAGEAAAPTPAGDRVRVAGSELTPEPEHVHLRVAIGEETDVVAFRDPHAVVPATELEPQPETRARSHAAERVEDRTALDRRELQAAVGGVPGRAEVPPGRLGTARGGECDEREEDDGQAPHPSMYDVGAGSSGPRVTHLSTPVLLVVERGVHLGYLLRLARLVRRRHVRPRLAAEVEAERAEVEAVAAVGADLLERRE
jgi:hypothetical protein